jgi:nucleoside-diphosphate-sugar epimerase
VKTLIIGCGYLGLPLALRSRDAGDEVWAWVHSPSSAEALAEHRFARVIAGSVAEEALWNELGDFDQVFHCASSGRGGVEAYREVFLEGARKIVAHQPKARKLFVSSTSVYGQAGGEIVTEESSAEPATETGTILREAEMVVLGAGGLVVRSSGIYGPRRAMLFEKLRRGEAVIEGDGSRWINQIHRDDLVEAVAQVMACGEPGTVYNASDDEPVRQRDFYTWCAEFLHKPIPPYGPVKTERKRGLTNKRVSNARLRGLGWMPKYPTFREGLQTLSS